MPSDKLLVRNMVCHRCVLSVEDILRQSSIPFEKVVVGEVFLEKPLTHDETQIVKERFAKIGLELIDNKMGGLIEKIKTLVIKRHAMKPVNRITNLNYQTISPRTCITNTRISAVCFHRWKEELLKVILLNNGSKK